MQKASRHITAVLGRVLFIGFSVQIVLGFLWACCNFGDFQEYGDSLFYIRISKTLLFDEYTGALYPVLLMLVRGIEGILRIPYLYTLQILQLLAAGFVGYYVLRIVVGKRRLFTLWGSLAILTFPMLLQCHLAVLPHSFTFSACLLELAFVVQAIKCSQPLSIAMLSKIGSCWLVSALLMPEYLYFGAVPVVLLLIYDMCRYRKQKGLRVVGNLLVAAVCAGVIVGVGNLTSQDGAYGRPEQTMDAALFKRCAWTSICDYHSPWPQDMQAAVSYALAHQTAGYADNVDRLLWPQLKEAVGEERAQEMYRTVGMYVWKNNTRQIAKEILWDAAGYTMPPVIMKQMLQGRGYDSYVGRNYELMKEEAPLLTRHYIDYSSFWFPVGIMISFVIMLLQRLQGLQKKQGEGMWVVICICQAGLMILWYTMQGAGMWDYRNALLVGALWVLWMIRQTDKVISE